MNECVRVSHIVSLSSILCKYEHYRIYHFCFEPSWKPSKFLQFSFSRISNERMRIIVGDLEKRRTTK